MILNALLLTIFPACMIYAAMTDLFTMTVPNRISIVLAVGFLLLAPFVGLSLAEVGIQLVLGLTALGVGILFFARGWIGGGDAKLFAATALWLSPSLLLHYTVAAAVFGGMLTLALIAYRNIPLSLTLMQQSWIARLHNPREGVPYGIALAAAGLLTYAQTPFMMAIGR